MRIDILTIFPGMFRGPFEESIVKRAVEKGIVQIFLHDIRDYASDKHRTVDDYPFGGGQGMLMKPEPLFAAVEDVQGQAAERGPIVFLTPQGRLFDQKVAVELASHDRLILICGHYEGVDARVHEHLATDEISIGDYVLSGGELAAMVLLDACVRLIPGVMGKSESGAEESFEGNLLEYPQFTRPREWEGLAIPDVLLSGDHAKIAR
ncbi:MAG: tRNA (guanosine(37)-N1)-methyltransferase TrmD, partial [Dehalococcoidia bacterium]|nr:tRNA (guanosine(37)-N1)-methyltransferase TrmD [Dehalococcoidia bacterium]